MFFVNCLFSDYGNPLGIESGMISDNQFSSPSAILPSYEPFRGRLNSASAWCVQENGLHDYLQIDLLTPHLIQQVCHAATAGRFFKQLKKKRAGVFYRV